MIIDLKRTFTHLFVYLFICRLGDFLLAIRRSRIAPGFPGWAPHGMATWLSDRELIIDKQSMGIAQLFSSHLFQRALWI